MKNIELVTRVAHHITGDLDVAKELVQELNDGGFLTPDLPKPKPNDPNIFVPNGKGWLPVGPDGPSIWTAPGGTIMVQRIEPGDLTPEEARQVAYSLLFAAEYSKGGEVVLSSRTTE